MTEEEQTNALNTFLEGEDFEVVILPYLTPTERTLGTLEREAIQSFLLLLAVAALEGLDRLAGNQAIGWREIAIAVVTVLLKAGITVSTKYIRASEEQSA